MTAAARPRPAYEMTQVMRPTCEVYGAPEIHSYFGVGINSFGSPCIMDAPIALWWSDGTAWDAEPDTSKKSTSVFAANDALIQQGCGAKGRKHHIVFAAGVSLAPPAPVAVWGHTGFHVPFEWTNVIDQDRGESTVIYAPRHVKASIDGTQEVATIRWTTGGSSGPGNVAVCCDPFDVPSTFATQTPNTVFLGMTQSDTVGAVLGWMLTSIANGLIKLVIERLVTFGSHQLAKYVRRAIGRVAAAGVRALLRASRELGFTVLEHAAEWAVETGVAGVFNTDEAAFDHTAIDDQIADLWDAHVVSP